MRRVRGDDDDEHEDEDMLDEFDVEFLHEDASEEENVPVAPKAKPPPPVVKNSPSRTCSTISLGVLRFQHPPFTLFATVKGGGLSGSTRRGDANGFTA